MIISMQPRSRSSTRLTLRAPPAGRDPLPPGPPAAGPGSGQCATHLPYLWQARSAGIPLRPPRGACRMSPSSPLTPWLESVAASAMQPSSAGRRHMGQSSPHTRRLEDAPLRCSSAASLKWQGGGGPRALSAAAFQAEPSGPGPGAATGHRPGDSPSGCTGRPLVVEAVPTRPPYPIPTLLVVP